MGRHGSGAVLILVSFHNGPWTTAGAQIELANLTLILKITMFNRYVIYKRAMFIQCP